MAMGRGWSCSFLELVQKQNNNKQKGAKKKKISSSSERERERERERDACDVDRYQAEITSDYA